MVVLALTISVRAIANNTTYWKKYHSADLALMTDLILTNQGDFSINYNLKEIHPNIVTKTLRIKPLVFQIFLKDGAFFVYDESSDKDRFPQSYIFGGDPVRNVVKLGDTTNNYITLQKQGQILTMDENYVAPTDSCPSNPTPGDTSKKHFEALALSDNAKDYSTQINAALARYGGIEEEMHIFLMEDSTKSTTIYYNSNQPIKSRKMTCLLKRKILQDKPDLLIIENPYNGEFDTNSVFITDINNKDKSYNYWIIIQVNNDLTKIELSKIILSSIDEYYK